MTDEAKTPETKPATKGKPGRPPAIKPKPVETKPPVETPPVDEALVAREAALDAKGEELDAREASLAAKEASLTEKVNTGNKEKPLVDTKQPAVEVVSKKCPNHPEAKAVLYGMCTACYDKLTKAKKRGLYLKARLSGSNTHNYPLELRKVWRREVALIDAGLWKRPLKTKAKTSMDEALAG